MRETLTELQQLTLGLIEERGKENPITGAIVATTIGLKPRKDGKVGADMRAIIHALRVKGYPICASTGGYWWPKDQSELSAYIMSLDARIADQVKALTGLKSSFGKVGKPKDEIMPQKSVFYRAMRNGAEAIFELRENAVADFLKVYPDAKSV